MQLRYALTSACGGVGLLLSTQSLATTYVGPVYPPPGGVTFSSNGVQATDTGRIATYQNFDLSASSQLFFGIYSTGLAMDGTINSPGETLTFNSALSNLLGGVAVYNGTTTVNNFGSDQNVYTLFTLNFQDLAGNALAISTNPDIGSGAFPVLNVQGNFKVVEGYTASSSLNGTYVSASSYFNGLNTPNVPGLLKSSFSGGFYYTPSAVPEPASWAMMLVGFGAVGASMRRSRRNTRLLAQIA